MIRKLNSKDNSRLMEYLNTESSLNLFIIGNIESFGYTSNIQDIWADIDEEDNIKGVLLRYHNFYIPYSRGDFDVKGFADIIQRNEKREVLSGKRSVAKKFDNIIEFTKKRHQFFAEMKDNKLLDENIDMSEIKKATVDDVDLIIGLRKENGLCTQ